MKKVLTVITGFLYLASFALAAEVQANPTSFDHAEYLQTVTSGNKKKGQKVAGSLSFDSGTKSVQFLDKKEKPAFNIPYGSIQSMLYEQTSKPRYLDAFLFSALFLLTHEKKHFLTIHFTDASGAGQFVIVHLDKKNVREAIAEATAETGKSVERTTEN
jgi:hypothetical protein